MRHLATDRRRRPAARALRGLGLLLSLGMALAVAGAVLVVLVLPRAVNGQAMTVLTGSMTPELPVGSVVLVRPVDPRTVEVGDVLTYQPEEGRAVYVTHRLVEIDASTSPTSYVLQGDANSAVDDPVVAEQIRGEVWFHVPWLGAIRDTLHGQGGVTLLATLVLAGYAVSQVGAGLRERRQDRRHPARPDHPTVDRPVYFARFDLQTLRERHLTPPQVAEACGGLLVEESQTTCTIVCTGPRDGRTSMLERLSVHGAREVLALADGDRIDLPGATAPDLTAGAHARRHRAGV